MKRKSDRVLDAENTLLEADLEAISDRAYVVRIYNNAITYVLDYDESLHMRLITLGHKAEKSEVALRWEITTLDDNRLEIAMT